MFGNCFARRFLRSWLLLALTLWGSFAVAQQAATPPAVAELNGVEISFQEFGRQFSEVVRKKFYHGTVPEAELDKLKREVLRSIVERRLLHQEIAKRGWVPDEKAVDAEIALYDQRYQGSPQWQQNRAQVLPGLREYLGQQELMKRLEAEVREVKKPDDSSLRAYYDANLNLFVEPERVRVSVILLRVDPSSIAQVWADALEKGQSIRKEIDAGGDFAELARKHSAHPSAESGGGLGYIHRGMLSEEAHQRIDKMTPGEVTEALRVLEGVIIMRLDERVPAVPRAFSDVKGRLAELWARAEGDRQWQAFRAELVKAASLKINDAYPQLKDAFTEVGSGG